MVSIWSNCDIALHRSQRCPRKVPQGSSSSLRLAAVISSGLNQMEKFTHSLIREPIVRTPLPWGFWKRERAILFCSIRAFLSFLSAPRCRPMRSREQGYNQSPDSDSPYYDSVPFDTPSQDGGDATFRNRYTILATNHLCPHRQEEQEFPRFPYAPSPLLSCSGAIFMFDGILQGRPLFLFLRFFDLGPRIPQGNCAVKDQLISSGIRVYAEIPLSLELITTAWRG
jgi:hypothetical protein